MIKYTSNRLKHHHYSFGEDMYVHVQTNTIPCTYGVQIRIQHWGPESAPRHRNLPDS